MKPPIPISSAELTRGGLLARSTLWNLAGQALPMAAAIFAIPPIVHGLGLDRFGILTLGWVVVGYFSLFDLGLGRALTKMVSDRLAAGRAHELHALIWTACFLSLLLGVAAAGIMAVSSSWLVNHILKVPESLKLETVHALYLLAASLPIVTVTSGIRGVLEALQRFDVVNKIRIPMAISVFVGPLLVLPFSRSLVWVFAVLVAGRLFALIAYAATAFLLLPGLRTDMRLQSSELKTAFRFGGWITASNLLVPVLVYVDRFVVGSVLSLTAVAFYTTPFEAVTRLLTIPGALAGVMFPAFAASYACDPNRAALLMRRSVKYMFLLMFPAVLILVAFAPEALKLWVGAAFMQNSSSVFRLLAGGVFVACLSQIPLALIQGTGFPDWIAKLQAAELPVYLAAIWWATRHYGLNGAALAWSARVLVDGLLLFVFANRLLPRDSRRGVRLAGAVAGALAVFVAAAGAASIEARFFLVLTVLVALAAAAWFAVLLEDERVVIRTVVFRRSRAAA